VTRLDFAVAMVRAAGLEAEADSRAGEVLNLTDENLIPAAQHGYVAVAREHTFIDILNAPSGPYFDPGGSVARLNASVFLMNLLDQRSGNAIGSLPSGPALPPSGKPKPPSNRQPKTK
jgi:hypothetical protein